MPDSPDPSPETPNFEEDLNRLQSIVDQLDDEPDHLNQALDLYKEGVGIAQRCLKQLEQAELQVQELSLETDSPANE